MEFACKTERLITALEMFKLFLKSDIDVPDCLRDIDDKIEEALAELYGVKREIKEEIADEESGDYEEEDIWAAADPT